MMGAMSQPLSTPDKRLMRVVFAFVAVVFFGCYPYLGRLNNPNENVRAYMTMSLVDHHTLAIDQVVQDYGWVNDMARVPQADGTAKLYSVKSPGVSYLAVPAYAAYKWAAPHIASLTQPTAYFRGAVFAMRAWSVALPNFVFLLAFERLLRRYVGAMRLRMSAVLAVALASNFLAYTLMLSSHALFASCAFAAFGLWAEELLRVHEDKAPARMTRALCTGFFAAAITATDYQGFVLSAGVSLAALSVFWRPKHLLCMAMGAAVPTAAVLLFHARAFGSPFTPGHKFCENPEFAQKHAQGFYGFSATPDMKAFLNLAYHPTYGFFSTAPFMMLGLASLAFLLIWPGGTKGASARARRAVLVVGALCMLLLWLALSSANNWRGGWAVGPRLLGAAPPFFAFAAAWGLDKLASWRPKLGPWLLALSVGLVLAGSARIGIVSVVYPSVPEDVSRPLEQLSLPLLRGHLVPHNVGELVGAQYAGFGMILACMLLAPTLLLLRSTKRWWQQSLVFACAFSIACMVHVGIGRAPLPASDPPYDGIGALRLLETFWEPPRQ